MANFDIYQEITDRIIAEMESGIIPWEKPWTGVQGGAVNWVNQRPYSLINQFLLGGGGEWASFKQITEAGGKVKKGAKSKIVVFWKMMVKEKLDSNGNKVLDAEGNPKTECIPILRYYNVFSIKNDVEGLEPKRAEEQPNGTTDTDTAAEEVIKDYINRSGVTLEHHVQDEAYYSPASDKVVLPVREQFQIMGEYYSTAFHELTHSTGHKSRLNRLSGTAHFGNTDYSKEELVAEIGAASILRMLGIETKKTFRNNVAYIQSWIKALRNDKRMIISATSRAEKAVALIMNTVEEQ